MSTEAANSDPVPETTIPLLSSNEIQHSHTVIVQDQEVVRTGSCTENITKWLPSVDMCVIAVVGVIIALICSLLALCCLIFVAIIAVPLLLVCLLVLRLLQFIRSGTDYYKVTQLKFLIQAWLFLDVIFLMAFGTGVFILITKYIPNFEHVMFWGLSMADWWFLTWLTMSFYICSCFNTEMVPMFLVPRVPLANNESGIHVPQAITELINCICLLLMESKLIRNFFPAYQQHEILGLPTWEWIQVSVFILIGYNLITLSSHTIVYLLRLGCRKLDSKSGWYPLVEKFLCRKYLVYCANGLRGSINFILTSVLLLLTWVWYFRLHLNKKPEGKTILDFGTMTCVSLLVCSLIWLLKTCVLLSWEARTVYHRLHPEILEIRKHLYFLGILGRHKYDIFKLRYDQERRQENTGEFLSFCLGFVALASASHANLWSEYEDEQDEWGNQFDGKKLSTTKKKGIQNELLMQERFEPRPWSTTMYDMHQVAQYFLSTRTALSKETYVCDILRNLKSNIPNDDNGIDEHLKQLIDGQKTQNDPEDHDSRLPPKEHSWDYFTKELLNSSEAISFVKLETWMERAHDSCLFLANTLNSSKEVVDCLNKIISALLIGATFIMWLLLTKLATTDILVIIASPLLAATFIFGETCKTLFEGIIFVYVLHPFHVGDTCEIEGQELKVKTIDVWKTIFTMVGTRKEVIYPNSELAKKMVINHRIDFNWLGKQTEKDGPGMGHHDPVASVELDDEQTGGMGNNLTSSDTEEAGPSKVKVN